MLMIRFLYVSAYLSDSWWGAWLEVLLSEVVKIARRASLLMLFATVDPSPCPTRRVHDPRKTPHSFAIMSNWPHS